MFLKLPIALTAKFNLNKLIVGAIILSCTIVNVNSALAQNLIDDDSRTFRTEKLQEIKKLLLKAQFNTKALKSTPHNIESIVEEYFNEETEEWEVYSRNMYADLTSGSSYSLTYQEYEDEEWVNEQKMEFIYNENGKLTSVNEYEYDNFDDEWVTDGRYVLEYDNNNRIIQITEEEQDGEEWIANFRETYTYNADGTISYEQEYRDDEEGGSEGVIYEEDGNVINERTNNDGDITYRSTYFNTTIEEYLSLSDYRFVWLEYENEELNTETGELELSTSYRIVEESDEIKVFQTSYRDNDPETDSLVVNSRDVLSLENQRIVEVLNQNFNEGTWENDWRNQYNYNNNVSNETESSLATNFKLSQNYPNPFNPSTVISYQLAENSDVKLEVFDMTGRKIATLINGRKAAGSYSATFDASALSSGIYIYKLTTERFSQSRKMSLIK